MCALWCFGYLNTASFIYMNALSFSPRPPKLNRNHTPTPPKKVAIDLTEKGEQQREQIQEAVFSFLALLRQRANGNGGAGIPRYVFEECKALADIAWRFQVRFLEVGGLGVWGCLYGRVGWHGCGWGFYAHTTPGLHKKKHTHNQTQNTVFRRKASPSPSPARSSTTCRSSTRPSICRGPRGCLR